MRRDARRPDWEVGALHRRGSVQAATLDVAGASGSRAIFDASAGREPRSFVERIRPAFARLGKALFRRDSVRIPVERGVLQFAVAPAHGVAGEWHRDDVTFPALSVFVPLIDLNASVGRVELQLGTQNLTQFPEPGAAPDAPAGTPSQARLQKRFHELLREQLETGRSRATAASLALERAVAEVQEAEAQSGQTPTGSSVHR